MDKKVFIERRNKILEALEDNSAVILFAGRAPRKSADEDYPYTPNRNFYYLINIDEDKDILLLTKINSKTNVIFFNHEVSEEKARWIGQSMLVKEIKDKSGIEEIINVTEFKSYIEDLLNKKVFKTIYLDLEKKDE